MTLFPQVKPIQIFLSAMCIIYSLVKITRCHYTILFTAYLILPLYKLKIVKACSCTRVVGLIEDAQECKVSTVVSSGDCEVSAVSSY